MLLGIRNGLCKCSFLSVEMMRKEATAWVEHFVRYHVGAWQRKAGSFWSYLRRSDQKVHDSDSSCAKKC